MPVAVQNLSTIPNELNGEHPRAPSALPFMATAQSTPSSKSDLLKPSVSPFEPVETSPAAPIIDSGKYFPQLHRF